MDAINVGDYFARYTSISFTNILYIGRLEQDKLATVIVLVDKRINPRLKVLPDLTCCKRISLSEVTFYIVQNGEYRYEN